MSRTYLLNCVGVFCILLLAAPAFGQSTFGSIVGTVKDPTGALIPAADVEVINEGTGAKQSFVTTSAGVFNVPNLGDGNYQVRVSAKGFSTYERKGLTLSANQVINLDVQLTLGATTNVVEVRGASPVIATETTDIS